MMLELRRAARDRRLYELGDIGTLRFRGAFSRSAIAEADGRSWRFRRQGVLTCRAAATNAADERVGAFEPRGLRRGGTIRWGGRSLALRAASAWRERYALADGDRELALLDGKGWGRTPVRVEIEESASLEPPLLLFTAFVVRGLAEDANGAAAAGASTAATA